MKPQILHAEHSAIFLPEGSDLRRLPRAPNRKRGQKFRDAFEDLALVYDVFRHLDGKRILLVCPPPLNLWPNWQKARFKARPSGRELTRDFYVTRSSMIVELRGAPAATVEIEIMFAGHKFVVPVQPNLADRLENSRVLFTMNKDNSLNWIGEWARFHQVMHNADAIILFDNGSTSYSTRDIATTLAGVRGLRNVMIISWPYRFGSFDPSVLMYPYWAHFLQNCSFSVVLRRLAGRAFGLLNLDIDELAAPIAHSDVFAAAHDTPGGFHVLRGRWVESVTQSAAEARGATHTDYRHVSRDPRHRLNAKKWALDPRRGWLGDLEIQPAWHRIKNMPREHKKQANSSPYWHFKGINTNWKQHRSLAAKPSWLYDKHPEVEKMFNAYALKQNRAAGSNESRK